MRPRQERREGKGTKERPGGRHPAKHEGEGAGDEGAAGGESWNARQGLRQPGQKGKQPRTRPFGARNSGKATGPPRLEHPGSRNPGLKHPWKKRVTPDWNVRGGAKRRTRRRQEQAGDQNKNQELDHEGGRGEQCHSQCGEKRRGERSGPEGDNRQSKKEKDCWPGATDWNIRGRPGTSNKAPEPPGLEHPGGRREKKDKRKEPELEHQVKNEQAGRKAHGTGTSGGQWTVTRTGSSGNKASSLGVERPGLRKEREATRTSGQGEKDQEQGTGPRRRERRGEKKTNERPGRMHPAMQGEKEAAHEGAAGGESHNARQGLGQPGRKGKQPQRISGASNSVSATGPPGLDHSRGGGPTLRTGTSGDETSSPGQHKEEKDAAAAGTSIHRDRDDQQERAKKRGAADGNQPGAAGEGASGPGPPEAAQGGGEGKGSRTRVPQNQGGQRARDQERGTRSGSRSKATWEGDEGQHKRGEERWGRKRGCHARTGANGQSKRTKQSKVASDLQSGRSKMGRQAGKESQNAPQSGASRMEWKSTGG